MNKTATPTPRIGQVAQASVLNAPGDTTSVCEVTSQVLLQHVDHVVQRIEELQELKTRLEALQALCRHPVDTHCPTQTAMGQMDAMPNALAQSHLRHL